MNKRINIAIDGPAGAGKSTIAKLLAKKMNILYVDTGALYRALAVHTISVGVDIHNEDAVFDACKDIRVTLGFADGQQRVFIEGNDITDRLRNEETGNAASIISAYGYIRDKLMDLQRDLANENDVIMDGRDIGSKVLPSAGLKIYLTASVEARASRRYEELMSKGQNPDKSVITNDIINRDHQDMTRKNAPLVQAEDAILVDSSDMSIDEVVSKIYSLAKESFDI